MALTLDDVKRIAYLARIEVSQHEAQQALSQLNGIFRLIGEMQAVNTDGVEPMSHAQDVMLRLREDVVTESRPARTVPVDRAAGRSRSLPGAQGH